MTFYLSLPLQVAGAEMECQPLCCTPYSPLLSEDFAVGTNFLMCLLWATSPVQPLRHRPQAQGSKGLDLPLQDVIWSPASATQQRNRPNPGEGCEFSMASGFLVNV